MLLNRKSVELLAPAGTWDALVASVESGADACYLGGKHFNMRMHEGDFNFDNEALKAALLSGALKAGVLDTWEKEPQLDRVLLGALAIATPHIAGYSADGKANGTAASVRTVSGYLGLPLTDWSPSEIPAPRQSLDFTIDAAGKDLQNILIEAILHTYDVMDDDAALRSHPEDFEKIRGDYPVRREPTAFSVRLVNATPEMAGSLSSLGFKVI